MKRLRLHIVLLFVLSFLLPGSGSAIIQSGQWDTGSLANTTLGKFNNHVEEGYKQLRGSVYHNARRATKLSADVTENITLLGKRLSEPFELVVPAHTDAEVPATTSVESLSSQIDSVDESDTDLNFGLSYSFNNQTYPQAQALPLPGLDKRVVLIPLESGITAYKITLL